MKNSKYLLEGIGLLNFAWERSDSSPYPKNAMDLINRCAAEIASRTEVLVIIGYSFPIFNRAVDSFLFEKMEKLKKIYVQSPIAADLKNVIFEAFPTVKNTISSRDIQLISALEYFHIPHEANRKIEAFIPIVV